MFTPHSRDFPHNDDSTILNNNRSEDYTNTFMNGKVY